MVVYTKIKTCIQTGLKFITNRLLHSSEFVYVNIMVFC